ncbi:MAG: hypothetical protein A3F16_02220 [Deltaproteobacteria bacterium RIFCSPHIGHO2_12_FULL_43_9]|nr:MAG: hypothetical protein A3F16_02220 [Deltaproteobacteria bacterium RIFCSPHIGHO2_12_FULL_43_9]
MRAIILILSLFMSLDAFAQGDNRCELNLGAQPQCDESTSGSPPSHYECYTRPGYRGTCTEKIEEIPLLSFQYCRHSISGWNPLHLFVAWLASTSDTKYYKIYCIYSEPTETVENEGGDTTPEGKQKTTPPTKGKDKNSETPSSSPSKAGPNPVNYD